MVVYVYGEGDNCAPSANTATLRCLPMVISRDGDSESTSGKPAGPDFGIPRKRCRAPWAQEASITIRSILQTPSRLRNPLVSGIASVSDDRRKGFSMAHGILVSIM
jgi:hypothetical protein